MEKLRTSLLEIAFEIAGPEDGATVLLLHGWPDDGRTWRKVAPALNAAGYRTIVPWLRGFGGTRFLSADTGRDGRAEALAQDAIDLMDALRIHRFAVVGHDWGARVAYSLAAVIPERLFAIAALSLPYSPGGAFPVPPFKQSRAWWYQWFMSVDRGAEAIGRDPKGFARIQWETWGPTGWFDQAEFDATARSFENPDWLAITLHAYRSRWRDESKDPRYDALHEKMVATEKLSIPTVMIQGEEDQTVLPESSEGKEQYFTAQYRRFILEGVGHFPTREAPKRISEILLDHLSV